ncbi:hypothetical protein CAI21_18710 [Alkalilimnicola ehrlichii]|uniref:Outer membrane protein beta-barrel domain-containing protein n=1 Tax=Alkalilimnicola ehrlichii TaxID=351052 RepID=A0A3E0WKR3_9GAMM|nr:hypothetical protein [Alkalilimnicola ehrlichii]RFA25560.1 hypothetical protein CAI21_18710 [Alkalilimnicola ehrlichii]RFA32687.1 hypothetical protein CAL65_18965 [Alkalilimnicola ehrlichii]
MSRLLLFCSLLFAYSQSSAANNFSYTYLEFSVGALTLDEAIRINDRQYKTLSAFSISRAHQFDGGLVLHGGIAGAHAEKGKTELGYGQLVIGVAFPITVTDRIDIIPTSGFLAVNAEACVDNVCLKSDDDGILYGLAVRAWLSPESVEIMTALANSTISGSATEATLEGAFWWGNHHSARLTLSSADSDRSVLVGYRYSW